MKLIICFAAAIATLSLIHVQADTLADWTFESTQPSGSIGPGLSFAVPADIGSGVAYGYHVNGSLYSSPIGNGSTHSFSANTWIKGDYFEFRVSTLGYNNITLSYDQTSNHPAIITST